MHAPHRARPALEYLEDRLTPSGLPNFSLVDLSPTSPSFGQTIDPNTFVGEVTAYYFLDPA
jgi:hypothetical protein